jgi:hypothetical protein
MTDSTRTNLVLARVGQNSLHPRWLDGSSARNWDLRLVPYQPVDVHPELGWHVGDVVPGPKWTGLRHALNAWDGWRDYDYIWLPDDDILAAQETINQMFEVARAMDLTLFGPALDERSYYAHFSTMRNARFHGRWVGFVEIMVPGFRRSALEELLFTLDLGETGWGWGLDSVWPKLLDYANVGIIDGLPVQHTRPVGEMRDAELRRRVLAESDRLLDTFECAQVHTTFGAFNAELEPLPLSPEELLADLVRGWAYLIDQDPRVLAWIMEFQRRQFSCPEYPVAGTPSLARSPQLESAPA